MKKMNKKGFTIVELVIVIAVIAILAAVMIPTFSGVVEKAQKSSALQKARNAYAQYTAEIEYDKGHKAAGTVYVQLGTAAADSKADYAVINNGVISEDTVNQTAPTVAGTNVVIIDVDGSVVAPATQTPGN